MLHTVERRGNPSPVLLVHHASNISPIINKLEPPVPPLWKYVYNVVGHADNPVSTKRKTLLLCPWTCPRKCPRTLHGHGHFHTDIPADTDPDHGHGRGHGHVNAMPIRAVSDVRVTLFRQSPWRDLRALFCLILSLPSARMALLCCCTISRNDRAVLNQQVRFESTFNNIRPSTVCCRRGFRSKVTKRCSHFFPPNEARLRCKKNLLA